MAGIGVKLQTIFEKKTIAASFVGFVYSTMISIGPMMVVILNVVLMSRVLGYDSVGYADRSLFSATILYIFIFSLLTAAPFNAVLSRYLSDVIYDETYDDIMACYNVGLLMNIVLSCLVGVPFCIREYLVGQVNLLYVFTGWIYSAGYGVLFHALSVYLQGLSENFPVFSAWYDFCISYGMDIGKGMSQKCYLQYASFFELWIFPYRKS